ncbi:hypothetical protein MC7420_4991 [Coleofasciculus chthonoplastes PCC 7420]|uniref:Uncharacterized protein n=1 Tax=Coleofasciculus chthonoplastes PCC 7420 TaxID=118168 RepID=B4VZ84_9CYAN|nr:hypothetical protein MC7420_4991 [Coleofasciculus chthonoplastes PCC 7420]
MKFLYQGTKQECNHYRTLSDIRPRIVDAGLMNEHPVSLQLSLEFFSVMQ